jgi:nucleoside-diphosphate-sugar epimerase
MKKVLLIGGAGFIGHNLAIKLKTKKLKVYIIDFLKINNIKSLGKVKPENRSLYKKILEERLSILKKNKIKIIKFDCRNYKKVSQTIKKINPNYIYHLAAVAHANISNKDPFSTFDHSFRTLENSLDASRSLKNLERFVYISSSMIYGNFKKKIVNEKDTCEPLGIYAALKFAGEKLVLGYNQVFNLPYNIIRPSALYGERCISRRVVQVFIENALSGKELVINDDGRERLDFTNIEDLTTCMTKLLEKPKSKNQLFNITFGNSRTILELINIIKKNIKNVKIKSQKRDKLVPYRGTLSNLKAKKFLNFTPKINLEKGIQKMITWYKLNHKNEFKKRN